MGAEFLSVESVAEFFDTSTNTVRKLVDKGLLPKPVEIGGLKRWDVHALRASVGRTLDAMASGRAASSADPDECLGRFGNGRKGDAKAPRRRNG